MTRVSTTALVLFGLLSTSLIAASPKEWDQEEQNRNAQCDNDCFFGSFPGNSCATDAACMCSQQKYRERYFCCMAKKCAASVMPDSIVRQNRECGARNMEFEFDPEAVCGIKLTTSSSAVSTSATTTITEVLKPSTVAVAATATTTASEAPSTITAATPTSKNTPEDSSAATRTSSGTSVSTTAAPNSASGNNVMLSGLAILIAASGMFLR